MESLLVVLKAKLVLLQTQQGCQQVLKLGDFVVEVVAMTD